MGGKTKTATSRAGQRAGVYVRVSIDRDEDSASPGRQRDDCAAHAARLGLDVAEIYEDRDVSAYSGRTRPAYERMLSDLRAGQIDSVVAWKLDRLTRRGLSGFVELHRAVSDAGGILATVHDQLDTSTPMGEGIAGMVASLAKQESYNTGLRVSRAHEQAAREGRPHGGSRMFGYARTAGALSPDPAEAPVVVEVAGRILNGRESLRSIAFDLNNRRIRTTQGKEWTGNSVKQMILAPSLAGLRRYRDELVDGAWDGVLTVDQHVALVEMLGTKGRRERGAPKLLSGVIRCALCGQTLKTLGFRQRNGKRFERYQCVRQPGRKNCGKVAITKSGVENDVTERLLRTLAAGALDPVGDVERDEEGLRAALGEDTDALASLSRKLHLERSISQIEYDAVAGELRERIERAEAALDELERRRSQVGDLNFGELGELQLWWAAADAAARKRAVKAAIAEVTVHPAKSRGGNVYRPERVTVEWNMKHLLRVADAGDVDAYDPDDDSDRLDAWAEMQAAAAPSVP